MRRLLVLLATLIFGQVEAGHDWGGMDLCRLYPERMPPGMPLAQLPQPQHPGARLMQQYCAQCHNLPGPGRHTVEEWPAVLDKMDNLTAVSSRFGGLLGKVQEPSLEERQTIRRYILANALQPMRTPVSGLAGNSYGYHCSGCHALPDPTQHRPEEWPTIMARMARNREVMKREPLSAETQLTILPYLQQASSRDNMSQDGGEFVQPSLQAEAFSLWRPASWLALGPFLLLVLLGLWRWQRGVRHA